MITTKSETSSKTTPSLLPKTMDPPILVSIKKANTITPPPKFIPHVRISCLPTYEIATPEITNAVALINACVIIWNKVNPSIPLIIVKAMTPRCTEVLNAIIFLTSNHLPRKSMGRVTAITLTQLSNLTSILNITPATTMVEECNNEETGVGPSMAIGNQYLNTHIADFLIIAIRIHTQFKFSLMTIAIKAKSPNRLYITAAIPLPFASGRYQNLINKKLISPMNSHLKTNVNCHLIKKHSIPNLKR